MPKTIHLGPLKVSIYADGYVAAGMTACGRGHVEQDEGELTSMTLIAAEVTCKVCMKTLAFRSTIGSATPSIVKIPRMRTSVFRARGIFDENWNRKLRSRLGLPDNPVTAAERTEILGSEDEIHAGYDARKTYKGLA